MTFARRFTEAVDSDGSDDQSSLSFGAWRTPSSTRPSRIQIGATVDPTGGTAATINLEVDEGGGTTADYQIEHNAPAGLGSVLPVVWSMPLPAGASYRVVNTSDPNGANSIDVVREWIH